jgi:carbonic anhydrase
MVAHLVHADDEGHLAVVVVLLKSGASDAFLRLEEFPCRERKVL